MDKYDDIIRLSRPISDKHPPMSRENRAAQFAPFAALVGYEDSVQEQARLTDRRIERTEEQSNLLNQSLALLSDIIQSKPTVTVTFFVPDGKKDGGHYETVTAPLRRIDIAGNQLILSALPPIPLSDILVLEPSTNDKNGANHI